MQKKWLQILVVSLICILFLHGCSGKKTDDPPVFNPVEEQPEPDPDPEEPVAEDPEITLENVVPACVVIDNHAAARPQSGLQEATIIYEFLAEGGISRFMAVFDRVLAESLVIGPVRSLRPYFAETALEYGGAVMFSGTSFRTEQLIAKMPLKKIIADKYFWRDSSRKAPHNLYTDLGKLYAGRGASEVETVKFLPAELPAGEEGTELEVVYSKDNIVRYTYDEESKSYLRYHGGKPHTDRETGKQYRATRVIVRKNRHTDVENGLVNIDLGGSGTAVLYELGQKYDLTWEKKD
ncbi:MAG TPA: DUF3048 domain-containing protein, partial [Firmicutes bacterium]|nr:DUF3048 domain-containing protein [Bacillota bacterium]